MAAAGRQRGGSMAAAWRQRGGSMAAAFLGLGSALLSRTGTGVAAVMLPNKNPVKDIDIPQPFR